jgi:hypothetical protein
MKTYLACICSLLFSSIIIFYFNHGIASLDARFSYSVENARYFLSSLSAEEKARHFAGECVDLFLFIPSYTFTLLVFARKSRVRLLRPLAFFTATADIVETSTILFCLYTGAMAPHYLPYSTTLKWLGCIAYLLLFSLEKSGLAFKTKRD